MFQGCCTSPALKLATLASPRARYSLAASPLPDRSEQQPLSPARLPLAGPNSLAARLTPTKGQAFTLPWNQRSLPAPARHYACLSRNLPF